MPQDIWYGNSDTSTPARTNTFAVRCCVVHIEVLASHHHSELLKLSAGELSHNSENGDLRWRCGQDHFLGTFSVAGIVRLIASIGSVST